MQDILYLQDFSPLNAGYPAKKENPANKGSLNEYYGVRNMRPL